VARLRALAILYLKLGTIAFGGPAAHIALMEDEVVRRRCWLSRQDFLDLFSVASLIPGPSSTETAIYVGYTQAGVPGLIVAGTCFILPAMVLVIALAWAYQNYGQLAAIQDILYGIKPVVIALVLQALWRLGRSAVKTWFLAVIGLAALAATLRGVNLMVVLFGAGALTLLAREFSARPHRPHCILPLALTGTAATTLGVAAPAGLWSIFLVFLKVGSIVFGSGYVLLAFLQDELVTHRHWLSSNQLLDAIVIGQVTPGPVFTTATFIGYLLHGTPGALVATLGIFLPAFFFVGITAPIVRRLRQSPAAGAFLDGLNVASLVLMAVVTWQLGASAIKDIPTAVIAVVAAALLLWRNINSAWLILASGVAGLVLMHLGR